jgi:hypothetical protein
MSPKVDPSYGDLIAARIPIPKVHINGKFNTRMGKDVKNQCLVGRM